MGFLACSITKDEMVGRRPELAARRGFGSPFIHIYTYIICLLGLPLYCIKTNRMIHTMMYDNMRLWAKQHCDHRETQIFVCLLCSFVCFVCLFVCVFFLFVMFASPGFLLPHSSRQARTLLACFAPL